MADGKYKKHFGKYLKCYYYYFLKRMFSLCNPNNYKLPRRTEVQFLLYGVVNIRLEVRTSNDHF